jgi:hypothetical protein
MVRALAVALCLLVFGIGKSLSQSAISIPALATPSAPSGTPTTGTGSLPAGIYYARVVALDSNGFTTAGGSESSGVTLSSPGEIAWSWTAVSGAASYQLWVGTSAASENTFVPVSGTSYMQNATLPSGAMPTANSSGSLKAAGAIVAGSVTSMDVLQTLNSTLMAQVGQVTLTEYKTGSRVGGGTFKWLPPGSGPGGTNITPDGCVYFQPSDDLAKNGSKGVMARMVADSGSPEMCGAQGDSTRFTGSVTSGLTTITGTNFTSWMNGKLALIPNGLGTNVSLVATITYNSPTQITMSAPVNNAGAYATATNVSFTVGSDDTAALNAWAAVPWKRSMQRKQYLVTDTINMNGELGATLGLNGITWWGVEAAPGSTILMVSENKPILTIYGSRGSWQLPRLVYNDPQTVTFATPTSSPTGNIYSVGLMVDPYPGLGGLYMSHVKEMRVEQAAIGFGVPTYIQDTLSAPAKANDTTIKVAHPPTTIDGSYPWILQMYVQVHLDNNSWATSRITNISGNTLTLASPLPSAAGNVYIDVVHTSGVETSPTAFNDTLASSSAGGTSTITVSHSGSGYPWAAGMSLWIHLDNGTWLADTISSVSGTTLTLASLLPSSTGTTYNQVAYSPISLAPINIFSNTWDYVQIVQPTFYGWYDAGSGTQDIIANRYVQYSAPSGDNWGHSFQMLKSAIVDLGRSQDYYGITNLEHFIYLSDAWLYSSSDGNVAAGSIHIEGARLLSDGTGLLHWKTNNAVIDALDVAYTSMLVNNTDQPSPFNTTLSNGVGIFRTDITAHPDTSFNKSFTGKGKWIVHNLSTMKNVVDASASFSPAPIAFLQLGGSPGANYIDVEIDTWNASRDGGFYPARQLASPSNGPAPFIKNLMPDRTVAYTLRVPQFSNSTCYGLYTTVYGVSVNKILLGNGSGWVYGTPKGGIYLDNACTAGNLLSATSDNSGLLNTSSAAITWPLGAAAQNSSYYMPARAGNYVPFWLEWSASAGTYPPPITTNSTNSGTSWAYGRNGGDTYTNMVVINLPSAPAYPIMPGQMVTITGANNAAISGTVTAYVVDVASSTQLYLYVENTICTDQAPLYTPDPTCGSPTAPTPETSLSIQVVPTVDVFILGDKY